MDKIYVTRPNLPSLDLVCEHLKVIWENRFVTNNGPYHRLFEQKLAEFLGVENVSLFANGTLALLIALQSLKVGGEVITTPYTFVATVHSLWWNGITPVFCDIEEESFNIDPNKIESLITPKTSAILAVHVYGRPCNLKRLQEIADTYGLKLIYDAAHAFGVRVDGKSIFEFGDVSIASFHGTKLFTTFEGGAIFCKDGKLKNRIDYLKNFGFADEVTVIAPGINAKMNEFQSLIGLLSLEVVQQEIQNRKRIAYEYFSLLEGIEGIQIRNNFDGFEYNFAYFPILVDEKDYGRSRDELYEELKKHDIYARRYFYPLISNLPTYRGLPSAGRSLLPVANRVSEQILCLPIYGDLPIEAVHKIAEVIRNYRR